MSSEIPYDQQMIIISACCFAEDHYADPYSYAEVALAKEGITYNSFHEMFVSWYMHNDNED